MKRQDLFINHITVDGRDLGVWDKKQGGERDSEETTYKAGGGKQVALGGSQTVGNVTVSKLFDEPVAEGVFHWLDERVGWADAVVSQQPTDSKGNAFGRPILRTGKLKKVTPPDSDSESNSAALIEIEISCNA